MPRKTRSDKSAGKSGDKRKQASPPPNTAPTTIIEPGQRPEKIYPRVPVHPLLRLYAYAVDWFIVGIFIFIGPAVTGGLIFSGRDTAVQDIVLGFSFWVLPTGFWGQSPGKWVAGIIVIDRDGRVPGVAQAIPREMVGRVVSIAALFVGLAWMVKSENRQGWHDIIAGTYVVKKTDSTAPGPFKYLGRPELFKRRHRN
ncbi:MAG: RDD family protein [Chloroflexi bacterium]|nr:RDD family protein [Chloroflexota bacterium]